MDLLADAASNQGDINPSRLVKIMPPPRSKFDPGPTQGNLGRNQRPARLSSRPCRSPNPSVARGKIGRLGRAQPRLCQVCRSPRDIAIIGRRFVRGPDNAVSRHCRVPGSNRAPACRAPDRGQSPAQSTSCRDGHAGTIPVSRTRTGNTTPPPSKLAPSRPAAPILAADDSRSRSQASAGRKPPPDERLLNCWL
jgi:hypothetical protein